MSFHNLVSSAESLLRGINQVEEAILVHLFPEKKNDLITKHIPVPLLSHLYSSDIGMETGARLVSLTRRKKAWAGWSCSRRLIILMSSPTVTWSGIRNLVLSSTGSCFSPPNLSMMQGTLAGCSDLICSTSFTLSAAMTVSRVIIVLAGGGRMFSC